MVNNFRNTYRVPVAVSNLRRVQLGSVVIPVCDIQSIDYVDPKQNVFTDVKDSFIVGETGVNEGITYTIVLKTASNINLEVLYSYFEGRTIDPATGVAGQGGTVPKVFTFLMERIRDDGNLEIQKYASAGLEINPHTATGTQEGSSDRTITIRCKRSSYRREAA